MGQQVFVLVIGALGEVTSTRLVEKQKKIGQIYVSSDVQA